jgi:8-oxo-dGTP pyrophosphatase MutT (NUDIX family)
VKKLGPWLRKTSSHIFSNPWISVRHDDVLMPAGTPGIYGVVHFKFLAVGIIPIDEDGDTYLVGQYRYPLEEYSWEIPMGGCPRGTSVEDTALRELKEETGLTAESLQQILRLHLSNSVTDEEGFVFVARGLTPGDMAPEDSEDIAVQKVPFTEAVAMAHDGRITDALSVAGLMRANHIFAST